MQQQGVAFARRGVLPDTAWLGHDDSARVAVIGAQPTIGRFDDDPIVERVYASR